MSHRALCATLCFLLLLTGNLGASNNSGLNLTPEEKAWITKNQSVKVGVGIAFPPYMWVEKENGQNSFKGMVSDYLNLIEDRLGVDMQIAFGIPFNEALTRGKDKKIDFFPCLSRTPDRSEFLSFTKPYFSYPMVIITREDAPIIGSMEELNGKKVAVVKHLVLFSKLQNDYQIDLDYLFTKTVDENLEAVAMGHADACIMNLAVASYYIQKKGLTTLKIAAPANLDGVHLAMGIRDDWPVFKKIIEKVLSSITQQEKDDISQKWIRVNYQPGIKKSLVLKWSLIIGFITAFFIVFFLIWNRRLQKEIDQKEMAEKAHKESDRQLKTLIGNLPGIAYRCLDDENWTMLYLSDGCKPLTGYAPSALLFNNLTTYNDLILPEDRPYVRTKIQTSLDDNRSYTLEYKIQDKNGVEKWVYEKGISTDVNAQGIKILEGFITDITKKKRAEQENKKLQNKLQQAQKLESIGNLAGGIAHDFNNILSSIIGFSEIALTSVDQGSELEDDIREIHKAGKRAAELVKQILIFARKSDETIHPVKIAPIAHESLKLLRSSIPSNIEIIESINSNLTIMGNETQIHQIFMNLCTNASQAMEKEGGKLNLSVIDTTMAGHFFSGGKTLMPGKYIKIKISDTGPGIPTDIIDSVFDPYFSTKEIGEGTGLGLATVHGIVEKYSGQITVKSKLKEGTTFKILIPAHQNKSLPLVPIKGALPRGNESILLVDDETSITKMNKKLLESLGYKTMVTNSSLDALNMFKQNPNDFDIIITDMTMPHITGDKLAAEISKIKPGFPVILCTGYSKFISKKDAQKNGITAYIEKPIDKREFSITIRKALDDQ